MQTLREALKQANLVETTKPARVKEITPTIKQNYLYRKALMGMKGIPEDISKKLSPEQIREIEQTNRRVQRMLNIWKQELCIQCTNNLFTSLFPDTEFTKVLVKKYSSTSTNCFNTLDFKQLGIQKHVIIQKLIEHGYLPQNFYEL